MIYATIEPILIDFKRKAGRNICLLREKEIVSVDSKTGGYGEFVLVDGILRKEGSLGQGMRQDTRDNNGGGAVFCFVTTGECWRMLRYDGKSFQITRVFAVLFDDMGNYKEGWIQDYSVRVGCMNVALSNGGVAPRGCFWRPWPSEDRWD